MILLQLTLFQNRRWAGSPGWEGGDGGTIPDHAQLGASLPDGLYLAMHYTVLGNCTPCFRTKPAR